MLETCQLCKYGNKDINDLTEKPDINLKLVSGDHIETAKKVALACGIITTEEANDNEIVMTGEDFDHAIGGAERFWNEETE